MINKVILVGRVGRPPEINYTPSGIEVCKFSMATSETYKDKAGAKQEKTEWHNIVAWGGLAKICAEYVTKGMILYVEGKMTTREWTNKEGAKQRTTEVTIPQYGGVMKMLGGGQPKEKPAENTEPGPTGNDEGDVPF